MRSQSFKVHKDSNGNECRFNGKAFAKAVKDKADRDKILAKQEKRPKLTQGKIMEEISYRVKRSFDTIVEWKKDSYGPSNYKSISIIAEYLGIPEASLVTYLNMEEEGVRKMTAKELVDNVYQNCIGAYFGFVDGKDDVQESKEFSAEKKCEMKKTEHQKFLKKIDRLHTLVDMNSLSIDSKVLDKLHKVLKEFIHIDDPMSMERWKEICEVALENGDYSAIVEAKDLEALARCITREDAISWLGVWYIDYEIDMAERRDCYDNKVLPEEYFEHVGFDGECYREDGSQVPDEELLAYGCQETDEWGEPIITPREIYKDQIVTFVREVFKHDFPELVEE